MRKRKPSKYQKLISKFCKNPERLWKNLGSTKREMAIAKKLYQYDSDEKFWTNLHLPFKLNSLAWFISGEGKEYLVQYKKMIKLHIAPPKTHKLQDEKIDEDKKAETKPKNLLDFLR